MAQLYVSKNGSVITGWCYFDSADDVPSDGQTWQPVDGTAPDFTIDELKAEPDINNLVEVVNNKLVRKP